MRQTGSCVAASYRRFLISAPFEVEKNDSGNCISGRKVACSSSVLAPAADTSLKERRTAHNVKQLRPRVPPFLELCLVQMGGHQLLEHFRAPEFWKTAAPLTRCLSHAGVSLRPAWHRTATESQEGGGEMCARRRLLQRISGRSVGTWDSGGRDAVRLTTSARRRLRLRLRQYLPVSEGPLSLLRAQRQAAGSGESIWTRF